MPRPVLALLLLAALACSPGTAGAPLAGSVSVESARQPATVGRVVDGDTLVLTGTGSGPLRAGQRTTVRLLEVDTPEVGGGYVAEECFGPHASAYMRRLLPRGTAVRVERDRDLRDRYGRTLLYVYLADGTLLNELLVAEGYARAVLVPPNDRHSGRVRAAEVQARSARRGLWAACPP